MRSPWQFISDLANWRRQRLAVQSSDPTADDSADRLLLPAPSERPEEITTNGDTESRPGQSARPLAETLQSEAPLVKEASPPKPVGDSQKNDQPTVVAPKTSSVPQTQIVAETKVRAARAVKPASRLKPDVTPTSDPIPEQVPVERSFHDDVRSVEDDIKRLRTELADKLRLQNEQLKKMLLRFDRP